MSLAQKIVIKVAIPMLALFILIFSMLNRSLQNYVKNSEQNLLIEKAEGIEAQIRDDLDKVSQVIMDAECFINGNFHDSESIL